jgi:hypothetical protein
MPRVLNRPRLSPPTLFHPPPRRPAFHTLPRDIQETTIRLLARLLGVHVDRGLTSGGANEVEHE